MSKLYSSEDQRSFKKTKFRGKRNSPLWEILRTRINKGLLYSERITVYNAGSKINEFFLQIVNDEQKNNLFYKRVPNLYSKLKPLPFQITKNPLKEEIKDPYQEHETVTPETAFRKYSELEITPAKLEEYKRLYECKYQDKQF